MNRFWSCGHAVRLPCRRYRRAARGQSRLLLDIVPAARNEMMLRVQSRPACAWSLRSIETENRLAHRQPLRISVWPRACFCPAPRDAARNSFRNNSGWQSSAARATPACLRQRFSSKLGARFAGARHASVTSGRATDRKTAAPRAPSAVIKCSSPYRNGDTGKRLSCEVEVLQHPLRRLIKRPERGVRPAVVLISSVAFSGTSAYCQTRNQKSS